MRYQAQQKLSFPLAELFPYRASENLRSSDDYRRLAASLHEHEQGRRDEFLERLEQFRLKGSDSIRSFPAKLFEPVCNYEMPPAPRVHLHSPGAHVAHSTHHIIDDAPLASIEVCGGYGEPGEVDSQYPNDLDGFQMDAAFEQIPLGAYSDVPIGASPAELPAEVLADDIRIDWSGAREGTVSQIGHYHYKFDPNQSMSYVVRIGPNDYVWGIDLERVVNQYSIQKGDRVQLKCIGKQPVEVEVRVKQPDDTYKIETKTVRRNTWVARVLARGPGKSKA